MSEDWRGILTFESIEDGRAVFYCQDETAFRAGQKYLAVLTEIPDEAPAGEDRRASRVPAASPAEVARALSRTEAFQRYAGERMSGLGRGIFAIDEITARRLILEACAITEFEQLDLNETALVAFKERVEIPYYRHLTTLSGR